MSGKEEEDLVDDSSHPIKCKICGGKIIEGKEVYVGPGRRAYNCNKCNKKKKKKTGIEIQVIG
jgi:hypothetical protein